LTILFSIQNIGIGGVQTFMLRLAVALSKNHKLIIFDHYPYYSVQEYLNLIPTEIKYEKYHKKKWKDKLIWSMNALLKLLINDFSIWEYFKDKYFIKVVARNKVDVIVSFDYKSDYKVTTLLQNHNIPIVISMHGSYDITESYGPSDYIIQISQHVFKKASAVVYISDKNIRILKLINDLNNLIAVEKIYYGFEPILVKEKQAVRKKLGLPENMFLFGMIARADETKGWQQTIEAFIHLQKKTNEEIGLVCVGSGSYIDGLKKKFNNKNIYFAGFTSQPADYDSSIDVGLLPTYFPTENLPNTIIEYLACGKPVIATDYVEIPNMIDYNGEKAGILISFDEHGKPKIDEIAAAMERYLTDNDLLTKHSELAKLAFQKFDMDICVAKYENVFKKVLENKAL
jgi:L-malate glycosyltransferase